MKNIRPVLQEYDASRAFSSAFPYSHCAFEDLKGVIMSYGDNWDIADGNLYPAWNEFVKIEFVIYELYISVYRRNLIYAGLRTELICLYHKNQSIEDNINLVG